MKKLTVILSVVIILLSLSSCKSEKKVLHCDSCNKELTVAQSSNMTDEWLVYCDICAAEIESENPELFAAE